MPHTRSSLLLITAVALSATQVSAAMQVLLQQHPQSVNCPVTLYAQPRFTSGVTPVEPSFGKRAGVHFHVEDPDGRSIRSVEVTLFGTAAIHGAQPAFFGSSAELRQTFHVVSSGDKPGTLSADLWLSHAATIRSVSITQIDYAAAPAWHVSTASSCVTAPNGNQLIGSLH